MLSIRCLASMDWNERYLMGDTPWEKGAAAPPLRELLGRLDIAWWGDGGILVPGCGLGHDVRALAEVGLLPLGVDLSKLAIERARLFTVAGVERYEVADFLDPDWRANRRFDAIWEHTCFCAIDPARRGDYAKAAADLLVDGGLLAGVFFINPYDPGEDDSGPPFATSLEELKDRFGEDFEFIDGWVPREAYPGREGREWIGLFRRRARG